MVESSVAQARMETLTEHLEQEISNTDRLAKAQEALLKQAEEATKAAQEKEHLAQQACFMCWRVFLLPLRQCLLGPPLAWPH